MNALLIIKTASGFVSMPFSGDLPQADFEKLSAFCALKDSASYSKDGLLSHVERHFTPPPEPTP